MKAGNTAGNMPDTVVNMMIDKIAKTKDKIPQ